MVPPAKVTTPLDCKVSSVIPALAVSVKLEVPEMSRFPESVIAPPAIIERLEEMVDAAKSTASVSAMLVVAVVNARILTAVSISVTAWFPVMVSTPAVMLFVPALPSVIAPLAVMFTALAAAFKLFSTIAPALRSNCPLNSESVMVTPSVSVMLVAAVARSRVSTAVSIPVTAWFPVMVSTPAVMLLVPALPSVIAPLAVMFTALAAAFKLFSTIAPALRSNCPLN